jgi:glycosyltransferase involved in cell wall biosynthesis
MKSEKKLPFVSIIVCAYDAEKKIERAISSLLDQTYSKKKYEIIVVDDCSNDNTVEIVKKFPVRLIRHGENRGLAAARNSGLKCAKGKIYVCFDDDCIADKNWLKEIVEVYQTKRYIGGVAGLIREKSNPNLVEKFIQEQGCGNPLPNYFKGQKDIFSRFFAYIKKSKRPLIESISSEKIFEVGTIAGANSSFNVNILKEVGGWDENLSGVEDTDLISKIRRRYKPFKFYVNTRANIIHDHNLSFWHYVLKPWRRRKVIVKQYLREKKILPLFPFPILFLLFFLVSIFVSWGFFILSFVLLPQLIYFWFPIKFIKSFRIEYILFPYMLLIEETLILWGVLIGFFELKIKNGTYKITKRKNQKFL